MDDNKIKENQKKNRIIPHVPEDERFYICSEDKKNKYFIIYLFNY